MVRWQASPLEGPAWTQPPNDLQLPPDQRAHCVCACVCVAIGAAPLLRPGGACGRWQEHRLRGIPGWKGLSRHSWTGEKPSRPWRFAGRELILEVPQHDRGISCVILKVYGMCKWD